MKTTLIILLSVVGLARAVEIDLGPARTVHPDLPYPDDRIITHPAFGLSGTPLNGQPISFDVRFSGEEFIRLYTATNGLFVDLRMPLNSAVVIPSSNFIEAGSGYFLDKEGNQIGSAMEVEGSYEGLGFPAIADDVALFLSLPSDIGRPFDLYGFHYDLSISLPGAMIEENNARGQRLIEISSGHVFGVGPGRIPMDVVPDRGATLPLLGLALVGLLMGRKYRELDQT